MSNNFKVLSVSQVCDVIDLFNSCMNDYLYVYDFINDYYYISSKALERFALPAAKFHDVVANHAKFVYPPDIEELKTDLELIKAGKKDSHDIIYRWLAKDTGEPIWINCRGHVIRHNNTPYYMFGCINEIGDKKQADNVSGLLGESSLKAFIEEHLCSSSCHSGYIMRLGLDDFKEINEKLGIEYGDWILRRTAECISSCIDSSNKLYRIVSDEFVILSPYKGTFEDADLLYQNIRQAIDDFVKDNHYESVFTISAGVLNFNCINNCNYSDIMKLSEFSLSEAKRRGKNRCYMFDSEDYEKFLRKKHLTKLLRQAITNNFDGFEVFLQPLFDTDTNKIYGAEALMRFRTAEYGFVSPVEFIPILEETGLIMPAGKWILNQSLSLAKDIQQNVPDFKISINISYIQVLKSNIINEIISSVSEHNVEPSTVIIELTESGLLVSDPRIVKLWSCLKERGIHLALDDFGTGYSNFHYLNELKPDIIKIDRSFTVKALENDYEYNLLSLISDMVHGLNLKMCVEGIENQSELDRMKKLSPDYCQGYYFGKPCPYDEFSTKFIEKVQE